MGSEEQNKQSGQNRNRLTDTQNRLMVHRGEEGWQMGEKGEGTEKHRLVVTEYPWGSEVRHREFSQEHCNNCVGPSGSLK